MVIQVSFTEQEYSLIQEFAKTYNQTVSEFVRNTILERAENEIDLKSIEIY
ncbi:MAG: hypothetical protein IJX10_02965 [Phascolarctobacterium sp.]|nr:hypothetical protein [Phascolarctobacterium sp.]